MGSRVSQTIMKGKIIYMYMYSTPIIKVLYFLNSKRNVVILNRRNSTTRVLHVSFSGNMQSSNILNHDCAWKSYRGMECDLNGFQRIRYANGHVDILYSYDVSFAIQYIIFPFLWNTCTGSTCTRACVHLHSFAGYYLYTPLFKIIMWPMHVCIPTYMYMY